MSYIFRGRLCGYICDECSEPLANVKVRLYRTRKNQNVTALAVASPKDTFALLSEEEVKRKESSLIGEFETNDAGEFVAELSEQQGYEGEAFEVDVYCGTVPGLKPGPEPPEPVQFSVTVLQPLWRKSERGSIAIWDHCLSRRYWCLVRSKFGAWVICGHVVVCDTKKPVSGVKVSAFDVDWLQNDPLGSPVTTDGSGKFRIDYMAADFKKDVLGLNIELFGGPDLYFKVETLSGNPLLAEPSSRGRAPDRENVGNCFCVELCVKEDPVVTHAWFTQVGDFAIYSDIDHLGSGLTTRAVPVGFPNADGGPGFGFFRDLKLIGQCPTTYPTGGPPMRYRFLYEISGSGAGLQPINSANIQAARVGTREIFWDIDGTGPRSTSQPVYVAPGGAIIPPGPTPPPAVVPPLGTVWDPIPPIVLGPDVDGWVIVDPLASNQGFDGTLVLFDSTTVVPGGTAPSSGPSVPPVDPKKGTMLQIVFEAEPVSGATSLTPTLTNSLEHIYINNWSDVNDLIPKQFTGAGQNSCSGLSNALDIMYTTDHELMADWSVRVTSDAFPAPHVAPLPAGVSWPGGPSALHPRGEAGTFHLDISTWPACSYVVSLSTRRKLTDGENTDTGHTTIKTFCKD